jgi:hypothetical protein
MSVVTLERVMEVRHPTEIEMSETAPIEIKIPGGYVIAGDPEHGAAYLATRAASLGRKCGSCSLCCKVLDIIEMAKPAGSWCKHCKPGHGCTIYDNRPLVCRVFACQWLVDKMFGDEWKPTRSKMVLRMTPQDGHLFLYVYVDPSYPGAWRKSPYYERLKDQSTRMLVRIQDGKRRFVIDQEVEFGRDEDATDVLNSGGITA